MRKSGIRLTGFEQLGVLLPANRQAAIVTSGGSDVYEDLPIEEQREIRRKNLVNFINQIDRALPRAPNGETRGSLRQRKFLVEKELARLDAEIRQADANGVEPVVRAQAEAARAVGTIQPEKPRSDVADEFVRVARERLPPKIVPNKGKICTVDGCDRPAFRRGLCMTHYHRQRNGAALHAPIQIQGRNKGKICSVEGCGRRHKALGLCRLHYIRHRRGADLNAPIVAKARRECSVEGCDRPGARLGLCHVHYQRQRRGADMSAPIQVQGGNKGKICSVVGCDRPVISLGMCRAHYTRQHKGTDLTAPVRVIVRNKGKV